MKIVLASGSPRRRELLSLITENFAVCPADADESLRDGAPLADEVVRLSRLKAEAAMQSHPDAVCIGSDTMVTIDHLPLGKPKDRADAADMLRRLRGRTHEVLTGLAVLSPDGGASRRPRKLPDITRKALALPAPLSRLDFDCIYYTLFFPHFQ